MTVPTADRTLTTLRDEAAVRRVIEGYADAITRRDVAAFGALYATDAVWTIGPPVDRRVEGREAIIAELATPIAATDFLIFTVSNIVISVHDDIALSRATVHEFGRFADGGAAFGVPGMDVRALYQDELRRDGDSWLFTKRKYSILYADNTTVPAGMAFPLT